MIMQKSVLLCVVVLAAACGSNSAGPAIEEASPGETPAIRITQAAANKSRLGDPIEITGTLTNLNDFPVSDVEVTLLHVDVGEQQEVVLFRGVAVAPKATGEWKVTVAFQKGHQPDALISLVGSFKRAQ